MSEKTIEYEDINPGVWKPENPGDSISGVLVDKRTSQGQYNSNAYVLDTPDGLMTVWGSTVLDNRMSLVDIGDQLLITFVEKKVNDKGQDLKIYSVGRAKK